MVLQQLLEGEQPAGDALGVVEPVDADEELPLAVAPQRLRLRLRPPGSSASARERGASMPIGNTPSRTSRPSSCDAVDLDGEPEERTSDAAKWRRYVGRVEADQVGAEHALEQPVAGRQRAESSSDGNGMWRKKPMRASGSRRAAAPAPA